MPLETGSTSFNLILLIARVALGLMILAHGYAKVFRGGKLAGTAGWFDSIGMRPGKINAYMAAGTEIGVGILLTLGLLVPLAAAGLVALMTVAIVTVHRKNGFFVYNAGQGIEYCLMLIVSAITVGGFGGGKYSIDHAHSFVTWFDRPMHAFLTVTVVGFGGALLQLVAVYRPGKAQQA
jgi:putative oxidoreductase